MRTKHVVVEPFSHDWAIWFGQIHSHFADLLGVLALAIEHVGSTSVPGLAAKPIIDVDIVIRLANFPRVTGLLAEDGFIHEGDLGIHGREAFKPLDPSVQARFPPMHLYVCDIDSAELRRHLAFRDYLRDNPDEVYDYSAIKIQSAARFPHDIDGYMKAKAPIVERILKKALEEATNPSRWL